VMHVVTTAKVPSTGPADEGHDARHSTRVSVVF